MNDILYDFGDILTIEYPISFTGNVGVWANESHVKYDNLVVNMQNEVPESSSLLLMLFYYIGMLFIQKKRSEGFVKKVGDKIVITDWKRK